MINKARQAADTIRESQAREAGPIMSAVTSSRIETPGLAKSFTVTGEIHSTRPLAIEGEVEGTIDVTGRLLTVAPNGNVRASVRAGEVGVLGSRQGSVEGADKIYIRNGAPEFESPAKVSFRPCRILIRKQRAACSLFGGLVVMPGPKASMTCHVCEIYERDLRDVSRELEKRRTAQTSALSGARRDDMDLEIRALASARAEIEARRSKHLNSSH
jgi:Polymer-forming cytoskeletal